MKRSREEHIIAEVEHAFKRHCAVQEEPEEPSHNKRKRADDVAPVHKRTKRKHRASSDELRNCIVGLVELVRKRQRRELELLAQLAAAHEQVRRLGARNEAQGSHIQHLQNTLTMRCSVEPWQGKDLKNYGIY